MSEDKLSEQPPDEDEEKYINILLLSESSVEKSTFINSFANYLQYSSWTDAEEGKLLCIIPIKFSLNTEDGDGDTNSFCFLKDDNDNEPVDEDLVEDEYLDDLSKQDAKTYEFPLHHFASKMIRLIDIKISDTTENFESMLQCDGQFTHLHAVCFLLNPGATELNLAFIDRIIKYISLLDHFADVKVAFLFINKCSIDSNAQEKLHCKSSENVELNCFYFDNEGFKCHIARLQGWDKVNLERLKESWDVSHASSWSLINFILGDDEYNVQKLVPLLPIVEATQKPVVSAKQSTDENVKAEEDLQGEVATTPDYWEMLEAMIKKIADMRSENKAKQDNTNTRRRRGGSSWRFNHYRRSYYTRCRGRYTHNGRGYNHNGRGYNHNGRGAYHQNRGPCFPPQSVFYQPQQYLDYNYQYQQPIPGPSMFYPRDSGPSNGAVEPLQLNINLHSDEHQLSPIGPSMNNGFTPPPKYNRFQVVGQHHQKSQRSQQQTRRCAPSKKRGFRHHAPNTNSNRDKNDKESIERMRQYLDGQQRILNKNSPAPVALTRADAAIASDSSENEVGMCQKLFNCCSMCF